MTALNFFTPTFKRTGSELALFNLISNSTDTFKMRIVSGINGDLHSHLPPGVPFFNIGDYNSIFPQISSNYINLINKGLKYLKTDEKFLQRFYKKYPADFWYINTIMLPNVVSFAHRNKIPFIVHVHELEHMFINLTGRQFQNVIDYASLIIACSNTCAEAIKLGGRTRDIEICYPGIKLDAINPDPAKVSKIRKSHNINDEVFLWIMSGTMDVNKNPSVFVDLASHILKKRNNAYFIWLIAGSEDNGYVSYCKNKALQYGIANKIIWVSDLGHEYYDYFDAGNGFVLTSTRESFSMVTVEALYLGKPVVSFDCGGINEILNDKTGVIVNKSNVEGIVDAMIQIMDKKIVFDPVLLRKVAEQFNITIQQEKWKNTLSKYF